MAYYNSYLLDELHRQFPAILYDQNQFQDNELVQYIRSRVRDSYNLYDSAARSYYHSRFGDPSTQFDEQPARFPSHRQRRRRGGRTNGQGVVWRASEPAQTRVSSSTPTSNVSRTQTQEQRLPTVRTYLESASNANTQEPASDTLTAILGLLSLPTTPPSGGPGSGISFNTMGNTSPFLRYPTAGYNFLTTAPPGFTTAEATYLGAGRLGGTGGQSESWAEILASFMNPVPIRPTQAQIDAGTRLFMTDSSNTRESCVICFDSISEGQAQRELRTCGHTFHRECIDRHFQASPRCPLCRHDIRSVATSPSGSE